MREYRVMRASRAFRESTVRQERAANSESTVEKEWAGSAESIVSHERVVLSESFAIQEHLSYLTYVAEDDLSDYQSLGWVIVSHLYSRGGREIFLASFHCVCRTSDPPQPVACVLRRESHKMNV